MMRSRKLLVVLAMATALAVAASFSYAAVSGSRHDMAAMGSDYAAVVGAYGVCAACHVPHKAKGEKLWADNVTSVHASFGSIGGLCAKCHDGTLVQGGADMSGNVYSTPSTGMAGHKLNKTVSLNNPGGGSLQTSVEASGLPHIGAATYIECTSCHSVHNTNNMRPFLARNGSAQPDAFGKLCSLCHTNREIANADNASTLFNNATGIHPVNGTGSFDNTGGSGKTGTAAGSPLNFGDMEALTSGTGASGDTTWNSGAKLSSGTSGGILCQSCHVVHGNDNAAPIDSNLLFAAQGKTVANTFCEKCHQGSQGTTGNLWPNPGASSLGFHPADNDATNGAGRKVAITEPAFMTFGTGTPKQVMCTTCHGVHGITGGSTLATTPMLLSDNNATTPFCKDCHDSANSAFDQFHTGHFSGDGSGGSIADMPKTGLAGNIGGTEMDCNACHRAHNAPYQNLLRLSFDNTDPITSDPSGICVACHTTNPSVYTTAGGDNAAIGSHYVGDPTTARVAGGDFPAGSGYGQTISDAPEKLTTWPASSAYSLYGPISGDASITVGTDRGAMNCLSCHTVKNGVQTGDGGSATSGTTNMMLQYSGNEADIDNSAQSDYLCTGCHGTSPVTKISGTETGFTHPLWAATGGTNSLASLSGRGGVSYTANNHVSCESCHRAHDADTDSGTYILETNAAAVTGPAIAQWGSVYDNGTVYTSGRTVMPGHKHDKFCNLCHNTW